MIGARIRNEGGSLVQIDPSYENLAMKTYGSVTSAQYSPTGAGSNVGKATIIVSGCNQPILAVYCDGAYVGVQSRSQSGSTYTWEIVTSTPIIIVSYWIFDTTDVAQMQFSTTKGLRIRRESDSKVIFDSRYKYMRIVASVNTASTSSSDFPIPLTSGYAIALAYSGLYTVIAGGPQTPPSWMHNNAGYVGGFKANTNGTISYALILVGSTITSGPSNEPPTGQMGNRDGVALVLDMRNY